MSVSQKALIVHPLIPFPTLLGCNGLFSSPVVRGYDWLNLGEAKSSVCDFANYLAESTHAPDSKSGKRCQRHNKRKLLKNP
jgi:hypothetical protein